MLYSGVVKVHRAIEAKTGLPYFLKFEIFFLCVKVVLLDGDFNCHYFEEDHLPWKRVLGMSGK